MTELKPCPFCRSTACDLESDVDFRWWRIQCEYCNARGPEYNTPEKAKSQWNLAPRERVDWLHNFVKQIANEGCSRGGNCASFSGCKRCEARRLLDDNKEVKND